MSRFQLKTTCHTKIHGESQINEKRQSTDANAEMTEMWQFSDKDIKAIIMKMLQWAVMNVLKCEKKNRKSQQRNKRHEEKSNENFRTEKDNNWKKISLDGLNSKMEMNQWIWRYHHKNSPIWSTERKINEWKKRKTDSQGPVGLTKELIFYVFEIPVESKEMGMKKSLMNLSWKLLEVRNVSRFKEISKFQTG